MISLLGNLSIREVNGRNGAFRVGKLITDLGEFAIKSRLIEEFDAGTYSGLFTIARIFPSSYISGNRITCEVRAELIDVDLNGVDEKVPQPEPLVEPDPLDEERSERAASTVVVANKAAPLSEAAAIAPKSDTPSPISDDVAKQLFGTLWPLGMKVKLDSTCDREALRKQIAYLNKRGYIFWPRDQRWELPD